MILETLRRVRRLLYVEDNPAGVLLVREALKEIQYKVELSVVEDGTKALAYLQKERPFQAAATPDLILLDLNLPRKTGEEVLITVKADPILRGLPVVVFSSGADHATCARLYRAVVRKYSAGQSRSSRSMI